MTAAIDGRGQRINYVYDINGRVLTKTPVGRPASEVITYSYDTNGIGFYQTGRLTRITDATGATIYGYDHRGNLIERRQSIGSTASAALSYAYDLADRITQITYPSGRMVRYGYDAKGRVGSIETRASATAAWTILASNMSYQPFGAVESMTLGNGFAAANDRGIDGRLRGRRLTNASSPSAPAGTRLSDLTYVYDPDGNVTSIDDKVTPARSALFGYDAAGRLNMMVAEGNPASATYNYTAGTNRLASLTTPAGTRSIAYDTRGNPLSETRPNGSGGSQNVTLAYDGYARLASYTRSGEASLTHSYNGMDDRISTTTISAASATPDTRRFIYDPDGRVLG